jgi:PAS domain S-box-containing protein
MRSAEGPEYMTPARILVIEDERLIAHDLAELLSTFGHDVVGTASSGEEAVSLAEEREPHLILVDIKLKGQMDGIEAADRISANVDCAVVYLTSHSDKALFERAKETGPFAYLTKPITAEELHRSVEMALSQREMERQLRESERRFRTLLDTVPVGILELDNSGMIVYVNSSLTKIFGYSLDELYGKSIEFVIPRESNTRYLLECLTESNINEKGKAPWFGSGALKHGSKADIRVDWNCKNDDKGQARGYIAVITDITDRKKNEERLRLLSESVEQSSEGIAVMDLNGYVWFVNRAFAYMHGYNQKELIGEHLSIFHDADQMPAVEAANKEILATGQFGGEIWHRRRDGAVFPSLMHNSLLRDEDGYPIGIIKTMRDITDSKEAEEELRRSHRQLAAYSSSLEQKVQERTRDLERSQEELKRYSETLEKANEAMKMVIQSIEDHKKEMENKVLHNLNISVGPVLDQLKSMKLPESAQFLLGSMEFSLTNIFSSFGYNLTSGVGNLTPRELRICDMIRAGLSSKQMAEVLGVSPQTILSHRKNIRKKLKITNAKINLAAYLKANS